MPTIADMLTPAPTTGAPVRSMLVPPWIEQFRAATGRHPADFGIENEQQAQQYLSTLPKGPPQRTVGVRG